MSHYLRDELTTAVAAGQSLLILGTGVSISATQGDEIASWIGLIKHGLQRVQDLRPDLPRRWSQDAQRLLRTPTVANLTVAAERITTELRAMPGGHFGKWLKDSVGSLAIRDPTLLQSIADLSSPVFTTNYDTLVGQYLARDSVTWKSGAKIQEAVRSGGGSIVHLHGVWSEPDSIVFGCNSYADVLNNTTSQALIRALGSFNSIIFVGMGEGLGDPNFTRITSWLLHTLPDNRNPPLILLREAEVKKSYKDMTNVGLLPLSYGPTYGDLAIYLADIAKDAGTIHGNRSHHFTWDEISAYLGRIFGRIFREYRPDIVLAMSGPGNFAPAYCLKNDIGDTPLLCAVTFPKRISPSESLVKFRQSAKLAGWIEYDSSKWHIFIPDVVNHILPGSKVLLFDDRVITGEAQRGVAALIEAEGHAVKRAAIVIHPSLRHEVDYYEIELEGEYYFPWGGKYGRSSQPIL